MVNCNECRYINLTEEQQTDKTLNHMCRLHGVRLLHMSNNPKIPHAYIYPCFTCNGKDFEKRNNQYINLTLDRF